MRKLQLLAAALLLAATTTAASAQDAGQQGQRRGGDRTAALLQGITLTAEQQAKVDTLSAKTREAMMALRNDANLDQDARRAKSMELMTKQIESIKALLTDEQKKVLDKNVQDMQARMQQGGGRPPQL